MGVAGCFEDVPIGTLVLAEKFMQHDVDTTAVGDPITAAATPLDGHAGLDFSNGADVEEPSHVAENQPLAHGVQDIGHGPLHIIAQQGQNGSGTIKTGEVSGKQQVIEVASEPVDTVMKRCYPDTGGEKVVALVPLTMPLASAQLT